MQVANLVQKLQLMNRINQVYQSEPESKHNKEAEHSTVQVEQWNNITPPSQGTKYPTRIESNSIGGQRFPHEMCMRHVCAANFSETTISSASQRSHLTH